VGLVVEGRSLELNETIPTRGQGVLRPSGRSWIRAA
jgi:hypothetical protein